jgi:hypothetical protein
MKIIRIQRSCEHDGLRPLERHHRLVSRRTGLFYNVKKGDYGQCWPWKKRLGEADVREREHKRGD